MAEWNEMQNMNKKIFYRYTGSKSKTQQNFPLLTAYFLQAHLVLKDMGKT